MWYDLFTSSEEPVIKNELQPIEWLGDRVRLLDQTRLPHAEVYIEIDRYQDLTEAICALRIRGAPAIGVAGAYAVALGALAIGTESKVEFTAALKTVIDAVAVTRPTARNLFRALERMARAAASGETPANMKNALVAAALAVHREEDEATRRLSQLGAGLIKDGATILTHCNTGALATTGFGTALGIIKAAAQGKNIKVIATETRPLLQGARLTAWECRRAGIPVTLITDSMAGYFMSRKRIDCIIVGADRIAANGDTANKIGTYTLAVLAKENGVPFYVAAPTSTIDVSLPDGDSIPIEERGEREVLEVQGIRIAPAGCRAANPAFDITPHRYISAIITERGIIRAPLGAGIKEIIDVHAFS